MSDARAARNELKEFFGGPINTWASSFSASASLVAPDAGKHLRVFSVMVTAPSANVGEVELTIRDGADIRAHLFVPAGGVRYLKFDGRYLKVSTALRVVHEGTVEETAVVAAYREIDDV